MTITSEDRKTQANGDGSTTQFSFSFFVPNKDELTVKVTNTTSNTLDGVAANSTQTLTLDTDYSLSLTGSGGTVDFSGGGSPFGAPSSGIRVTLLRELDLLQETDYIPNDPFPAESHENALDRAAMRDQQINDRLDLTMRAPETDTVSDMVLPGEDLRSGKVLTFDSSGQPKASDTTTDEKDVKVSDNDTVPGFLADKLTVTAGLSVTAKNDGANETIEFSIVEGNIDHDNLNNFVANEHVDHSSITVSGGAGISGGGDLTSSRSLTLDIDSLTDGSPGRGDHIAVDISGTTFSENVGDFLGLTQKSDVGLDNVPNEDATDPSNWNQDGASTDEVLTWDGSEWSPAPSTGASARTARAGGFDTVEFTLADNTATSFQAAADNVLALVSAGAGTGAWYAINTTNGGGALINSGGSGRTYSFLFDTSLNGTTGTNGEITVAANSADGLIYVENRDGSPRTIAFTLLATGGN